jgi:predicted transcriptional regulator
MEYLTPAKIAKKWGVSRARVSQYLQDGRIPGAICTTIGPDETRWKIPSDATKPEKIAPGRKVESEAP